MFYFSPSQVVFCTEQSHGARFVNVPVEGWEPPAGSSEALPPTHSVPNPDCKMPADVREVPSERYAEIRQQLTDQSDVKLAADEYGDPIVVPQEAGVPHQEIVDRALMALRSERAPILSILDGLQATAATAGLAATLAGDNATAAAHSGTAQQIEVLKLALKNAPVAVDLSDCALYEQMRQKFKAYYATLVASAPADIRLAFKGVA